MTEMEFAKCMAVLAHGVGRKMEADQAEVWFSVLGDMTEQQLRSAVLRCLREYKFAGFPPIGVLRDYAGCGTAALPVNDRSVAAWDRVVDTIRRVGGYQSVDFDDPAINAAIRTMGGWSVVSGIESEELHRFGRQRFCEAYRAHLAVGVPAASVEPLPGILAEDAGRDGYEPPRVIEVETGLPSDVKVIGAVAPRIEAPPEHRRLLTGVLVQTVETEEFQLPPRLEHKPVPSADEQRAALASKYGA